VDWYVEKVFQIIGNTGHPYVFIEQNVNLRAYIPEAWGSVDCLLVVDRTLIVIDLKYGRGVKVDAPNNPQLRYYCLGAYESIKALFQIEKIQTYIIQPRINYHISTEKLSIEELIAWGVENKKKAEDAYYDRGTFNPGDHCLFCRAGVRCKARYTAVQELMDKYTKPSPEA
jgi:hypothetical protein